MTAITVKVTGPGTRPGIDLAGGTWAYATCGRCWRGRGAEPIGRYPGSVAPKFFPEAVFVLLSGSDAAPSREFVCAPCAGVVTSQAPQTRQESLDGRGARWAVGTCAGCAGKPATHLLKIYPERAAYPVVRFLCAACVRREQRELTGGEEQRRAVA